MTRWHKNPLNTLTGKNVSDISFVIQENVFNLVAQKGKSYKILIQWKKYKN